jgi:dihydrofolate reductase
MTTNTTTEILYDARTNRFFTVVFVGITCVSGQWSTGSWGIIGKKMYDEMERPLAASTFPILSHNNLTLSNEN